jgi:hypothetical protein
MLPDNLSDLRKYLNNQQTALRRVLTAHNKFGEGIQLFLRQHAFLHSKKTYENEDISSTMRSYPDEITRTLTEEQMRIIPKNKGHSIAWCFWHISRIEDAVINILVAGTDQVFIKYGWSEKMNLRFQDTGNEMSDKSMRRVSDQIDINGLLAYRIAVGRRTREVVRQLTIEQLKEKVRPDRIQMIKDQNVLVESAYGIAEYWGRRKIEGLLLMPATRHNLVHLNEADRLRREIL